MTTVANANPLYDTHRWTLSPNGTVYVLEPASGSQPARPIRLGRALQCSHRSKHNLNNGATVTALIMKVEVSPDAVATSSTDAMQSPTLPIQRYYTLTEGLFGTFTKDVPNFVSHSGAVSAFILFQEKPNSKEYKAGKWMKTLLAKEVRPVPPDPNKSNPSVAPRQLTLDFDRVVSPVGGGDGPAVFGLRPPATQRTPEVAERSREEVAQEVRGLTSSQPGPGELARAQRTWSQ